MSTRLRITFIILMTSALMFGYLHLFIPGYNFERLHIFLFNLCSGGTIILYYTEGQRGMSLKVKIFLAVSFVYAFAAFLQMYALCIILSLVLIGIVEMVRIRAFQIFPWDFFTTKVQTRDKFHQASLLCLSLGLMISIFAIANDEYLHYFYFEKLSLNTFFLGFSFPVSLITLSVLFGMMRRAKDDLHRILKSVIFWTINLGVIIFFLFILFKLTVMEVFISSVLFVAVGLVLYLYAYLGHRVQQKTFLTSGLVFLLMTAVTGILYILVYFMPEVTELDKERLLRYHAILSLCGWNLSGLAVICRFKDFPISLHNGRVIVLHWVVAMLLAPLGYESRIFAILAVAGYAVFLVNVFFSKGHKSLEQQEYSD